MPSVLQFRRTLETAPPPIALSGATVRAYAGEEDIERWLELRHRAFAREKVGVRRWTRADFEREFLDKWWWRPERMWFAQAERLLGRSAEVVGTVTLAMRGGPDGAVPVVHWLAVLPSWRRRGIARLLMNALERAAWDAGFREVFLETHAAWESAVRLYEALGYDRVPPQG